ncbi:hypothetical protein E3N88_19954 [Mikania micrantha]|uniref:Uncharacterized protein n=1 Tax=Mikania micrantha TaxID=192012 RepID=A0A5N6NHI3_9ASTR|nr:hypothetical protein E3N88_19954 [Mikania micrantha]
MVFKSRDSVHGIKIKRISSWYSNQENHFMVFKSRDSFHVLGDHNKGKRTHCFLSRMELAFKFVLKANCRSGVIVFLSRMELASKFVFKSQLQVWCHMVIKTADVLSNSKRALGLDIYVGFRANSDWTVSTHFLT